MKFTSLANGLNGAAEVAMPAATAAPWKPPARSISGRAMAAEPRAERRNTTCDCSSIAILSAIDWNTGELNGTSVPPLTPPSVPVPVTCVFGSPFPVTPRR